MNRLRHLVILATMVPLALAACGTSPTEGRLPDLTTLDGHGVTDSTAAPTDSAETGGPPSEVTDTLFAGSYSGIRDARRVVVDDEAAWTTAWIELTSLYTPFPERPSVDFATSRVVLISMGEQSSGGYAIELVSVLQDGTDLRVQFVERSPGAGCITTQALTQPALVIEVPRTDGTVAFDGAEELVACS